MRIAQGHPIHDSGFRHDEEKIKVNAIDPAVPSQTSEQLFQSLDIFPSPQFGLVKSKTGPLTSYITFSLSYFTSKLKFNNNKIPEGYLSLLIHLNANNK